jgi:hypothetical protein
MSVHVSIPAAYKTRLKTLGYAYVCLWCGADDVTDMNASWFGAMCCDRELYGTMYKDHWVLRPSMTEQERNGGHDTRNFCIVAAFDTFEAMVAYLELTK